MNSSIVIALPKIDDAKKIRTILNRHGFSVAAVCSTASTALASMSELDGGILICGYKLTDRYYRDVLEDIPSYFEMLLLASGRVIAEAPTSVLTVEMPMKVSDLVNTVDMMLSQIERRLKKEKKKPKTRSWKEQNYISNAKFLLMERNHLSEEPLREGEHENEEKVNQNFAWKRSSYTLMSPSRKSGCAILMSSLARSRRVLPFSWAMPYSVTT